MTPVLPGLPQAIADRVALALPDLASSEPAAGRFDLAELNRIGVRAPAVRAAVLGLGAGQAVGGPQFHHMLRLALYVVTEDRAGLAREASSLAIVERLVQLVHGNVWGQDCLGEPEAVAAENLHSTGARGRGIALWAVTWRQPLAVLALPEHAGALPPDWYAAGLEGDGLPVLVEGLP